MRARAARGFLSIWGLWLGVPFIVAIAFNTVAVFWVGLCDT
jgi:hypothetical protein